MTTASRFLSSFSRRSPILCGRINYFKVKSGVLKNDATLNNYNRGIQERFQHIQVVQGKRRSFVSSVRRGSVPSWRTGRRTPARSPTSVQASLALDDLNMLKRSWMPRL